ncbi:hypothetical protein MPNT_40197 [Candidatus Methylacidithermus pantelleriae]|uniref:Uncharacterized protein n=1 Tax=Candidatus Methylacidithermus pantelleriae TaxID=2744239 RepID=A0A8J2FSY0_9BACT|nr:hypothetical protein MPNT_40197 [Candidatus Methylacidithermus pantelleriae]
MFATTSETVGLMGEGVFGFWRRGGVSEGTVIGDAEVAPTGWGPRTHGSASGDEAID